MSEIDDLRKAMLAAQPTGKGQYIEDGQHALEVTLVKFNRTNIDGTSKETYIAEMKVLQSTNPTHVPGQTRSLVESTKNAGWLGRFKAFMVAACGADPALPLSPAQEAQIADLFVALKFDEHRVKMGLTENFLAGRRVFCEGSPGKSKGGTPVTNKKWTPAPAAAPGGAA